MEEKVTDGRRIAGHEERRHSMIHLAERAFHQTYFLNNNQEYKSWLLLN